MPTPSTQFHPPHHRALATWLAILATALLVLGGASAASSQGAGRPEKRVASEGQIPSLSATALTTKKGRTLYSLSVEKNGKFICTGTCLSVWHPLTVPAGVKPTGPVKLGTIMRPDGHGVQVTYRGRPLYSFSGDSKSGDANGEGIKDVGTWHAATTPRTAEPAPEPPPPPPAPENPYPY